MNKFADSQHLNEISKKLNQIVEKTVIQKLKEEAEVGRRIEFTGAVEVRSERDLALLLVVPLHVGFE